MDRPEIVVGKTHRINTGCGKMYVTINQMNGKAFEVFVRLGKAGGCASSQTEALGRLVSLAIRNGISLEEVVKELKSISCHQPCWTSGGGKVLSCADALAIVFGATSDDEIEVEEIQFSGACPECGSELYYAEGCQKCLSCGYSKCS